MATCKEQKRCHQQVWWTKLPKTGKTGRDRPNVRSRCEERFFEANSAIADTDRRAEKLLPLRQLLSVFHGRHVHMKSFESSQSNPEPRPLR
jgi:hypothetical protein